MLSLSRLSSERLAVNHSGLLISGRSPPQRSLIQAALPVWSGWLWVMISRVIGLPSSTLRQI